MRSTTFIAKRFLRTGNNFAGKYTGWVAVTGIAIGCFALIVSIAVLNGFESKVTEKIIGIEGEVRIKGENFPKKSLDDLQKLEGVKQFMPFYSRKGVVINRENETAVVRVKAVEMDSLSHFYSLGTVTKFDDKQNKIPNRVFIGKTLSDKLQLNLGDEIRFTNPQSMRLPIGFPLQVKGTVGGIFSSQVLDYDERLVFLPLKMGRNLFSTLTQFNGIDLRIDKNNSLNVKKNEIISVIGNFGSVETWKEHHSALVQAMNLEKKGGIIVLGLIIVVACFNLISNLVLIIRQKWRELGILKVMGYSRKNIRSIVVIQGLILGCVGCIAGSLTGGLLVWLQSNWSLLPLPEDIYFMEALPMKLPFSEFLLVPFGALVLIMAASYLASRRAVMITPMNAIQLEK
jgi:lipoprotein-releasing system permease protein